MNKKNVYLFQIQNPIAEKIFLPVAIGYLWSYVSSHEAINKNYELAGAFFQRKSTKEYLDQLADPDVVGFSTYVWNWEFSKRMAEAIKLKWPHCLIIMGGPHVPYKLNFQIELPYVDLIVTYGGEDQFLEILQERLLAKPNFNAIKGTITHQSLTITKRNQVSDVNVYPSPYLSGFFKKMILSNPEVNFNMIIETNRGCPYTCSFCNMFDDYYTKIKKFEIGRIKSEIDWGIDNKIDYIDCADSNFGIFERDIEIAEYIADKKRNFGIPRMFNFTSAKNQPQYVEKIQEHLGSVGIDRGISVSLQSLNKETLKEIKRWNATEEKIIEKLNKYKRQGLECFVELILGLPFETKSSWIFGINMLVDQGISFSLLIHPLSAVPNTIFDNYEYVNQHKLKFAVTRSPAQGFTYGHESQEEREKICYETATLPYADWLDCYIYSKCIIGSQYFHGLSYYVAKYLNLNYGVKFSDFFMLIFTQYKNGSNFFQDEYKNISNQIFKSLFELKPWGRQIFGKQDMFWSDQSAAAIFLIANINKFYEELESVILSTYNQVDKKQLKEVIRFNKSILEQPEINYPIQSTFEYNWYEHLVLNQDLINKNSNYEFNGRNWINVKDHALHIYWFGRKSSRCFIKNVKGI